MFQFSHNIFAWAYIYALLCEKYLPHNHYNDVIMSTMASQITGVSIVCSTVCWCANQRKHQSSVSLAFVRKIHRLPVDSPYNGTVIQKIGPFDDVSSCWAIIWMPKCQYDISEENGWISRMTDKQNGLYNHNENVHKRLTSLFYCVMAYNIGSW